MADLTQLIKHDIKEIRQGDPNFMLSNGLMLIPRAMMHITPDCPQHVRETINWATVNGYLKTVAHVQGKELTWEQLTK